MLLLASPSAALDLGGLDIGQHVEQVAHVEADVQRLAAVADLEFFFRLFLLGVAADDAQAVRR